MVVESGLNEGERIIVEGIQKVRPGMTVAASEAAARRPEPRPGRGRADDGRLSPMISKIFVDRPRLAIVIAIVTLSPARSRSDSSRPVPGHRAAAGGGDGPLSGASAEVVEATVGQSLESKVVGVDNMIYMKSTSGNDGSYTLLVRFKLGTDPDQNTVNVNNRIQLAIAEAAAGGPAARAVGQEEVVGDAAVIALTSTTGAQDPLFISNYATINILDEIKRINGVGDAVMLGPLDYSMRAWFETDKLTGYGLTSADIIAAIQKQNRVAPVGRIGAQPMADASFQLNIQTQGRLVSTDEFGAIIVRANADGSVLRVRDVARLELGSAIRDVETRTNGKPSRFLSRPISRPAQTLSAWQAR